MALCYSATNVWDASEIAQVMAGLKVSIIKGYFPKNNI
jgi:hypothetical protein